MSKATSALAYPMSSLRDVAARITDGSHFSPAPQEDGPRIANVKDMKASGIDFETCTHITPLAFRELQATGCIIRNGDVLLSKDGTVGRVVVYRESEEIGALSSICLITPKAGFNADFVGHALRGHHCVRQYENFMSGSALRRLVLRDIRDVLVPTPRVEVQHAIAQVLDTLDTAIRQTEAIIAKLKQVKQGLLHDLLTRGIDANGELRPPQPQAPQLYKQSPLGWIPKAWEVRPLAEVAASIPNAIVDGPFGSNLKSEHYRRTGVPVIQSGYVTSGEFIAESYVYVTPEHFQAQARSRVDPGDIVMAKIGANAGMCAVMPNDHAFGILAGNSLKISVDNQIVRREWLVHFLHRLYLVTGMAQVRTETAQPAISLGRIRTMLVPVPSLDEQDHAVCSLVSIEQALQSEETAASKLHTLKSGLMDDLLTGRVRVTPLLEAVATP